MAGGYLFANNARTVLASGITADATSMTVAAGTGALFPAPGAGQFFTVTLNDALTGLLYEIVLVTAVSGDTFTISRGQEFTAARAWAVGDAAYNAGTAGADAEMMQLNFSSSATGVQTSMPPISDCDSAPLGWSSYNTDTVNAPELHTTGTVLTTSTNGSSAPASLVIISQTANVAGSVSPFVRENVNGGEWTAWAQLAPLSALAGLVSLAAVQNVTPQTGSLNTNLIGNGGGGGQNYSFNLSFVAPCNGFAIAISGLTTSGPLASGANLGSSVSITGSGLTQTADGNPSPQTEFAKSLVTAGSTVTATFSVLTLGNPPNQEFQQDGLLFFVPSPS